MEEAGDYAGWETASSSVCALDQARKQQSPASVEFWPITVVSREMTMVTGVTARPGHEPRNS